MTAPESSDPGIGFSASSTEFDDTDVPSLYADSVNVGVGPYGVTLRLGATRLDDRIEPVGIVRLSPQLAYVMARILIRQLAKAGEQGLGYSVPQDVLAQAGLTEGTGE